MSTDRFCWLLDHEGSGLSQQSDAAAELPLEDGSRLIRRVHASIQGSSHLGPTRKAERGTSID